jgi:DNA invertase Pin-like site-specific DNA recombinase
MGHPASRGRANWTFAGSDAGGILSQKHEGWTVLPSLYDDGGFSGGTMERPALKRLIADIEAGQIDVVVVYVRIWGRPQARCLRLRNAWE